MSILIKMLVVLGLMIFLLKRKTEFGHAMLASSLLLFLLTKPQLSNLWAAARKTVIMPDTWYMLITLYFVMCLEHLLRTSGILKEFTASARKLFGSDRILLGFMPAFLGFLPSLGGAIFSAPLVKEAGERYKLSAERLTAINYWFRHVWEFSNPIVPGVLLASQLTNIPVGTLIGNQFIFTVAAVVFGALVLLTGKAYRPAPSSQSSQPVQPASNETGEAPQSGYTAFRSIILAAGPIFLNLVLVVVFHMNTALALGLVLGIMALVLKLTPEKIKAMLISSFDFQIQWGIINIIFFQQMLNSTGSIDQIVSIFEGSGIPVVAIISIIACLVGLLVGATQAFVAVAFPLVLPLAQGNLDVVAMTYISGLVGSMISPAHLCQIVTVQYFKADFLKALLPIILIEILMLIFGVVYLYVF